MALRSVCRMCGAQLLLVTGPGNKTVYLDAQPSLFGEWAIHSDGIRAAIVPANERTTTYEGCKFHLEHRFTCKAPAKEPRGS